MQSTYRSHRPESRTSVLELSDVAEVVRERIVDLGVRKIGDSIDVPKSTVDDWGSDLKSWPAEPLLMLARRSQEIGAAIVHFVQCQQLPAADPTAAIPGACETVRLAGNLTIELVAAVQAGRFAKAQLRHLDLTIDALSTILAKLKRDAHASAR